MAALGLGAGPGTPRRAATDARPIRRSLRRRRLRRPSDAESDCSRVLGLCNGQNLKARFRRAQARRMLASDALQQLGFGGGAGEDAGAGSNGGTGSCAPATPTPAAAAAAAAVPGALAVVSRAQRHAAASRADADAVLAHLHEQEINDLASYSHRDSNRGGPRCVASHALLALLSSAQRPRWLVSTRVQAQDAEAQGPEPRLGQGRLLA